MNAVESGFENIPDPLDRVLPPCGAGRVHQPHAVENSSRRVFLHPLQCRRIMEIHILAQPQGVALIAKQRSPVAENHDIRIDAFQRGNIDRIAANDDDGDIFCNKLTVDVGKIPIVGDADVRRLRMGRTEK